MSTQITVVLSENTYQRASRLAFLMGRQVADILADTIELVLPPFSSQIETLPAISELPDDKVLALADLEMNPIQDQRLSVLLHKQQAGTLTEMERPELATLVQIYQESLLRRAQALHEAVRRGLREPLGA
jgi:hypothetical protein